jgi:hypothetical protein
VYVLRPHLTRNEHEMSWSSHEKQNKLLLLLANTRIYDVELTMMDPELLAALSDTRTPPSVPVR